jgi:penicillin amidase
MSSIQPTPGVAASPASAKQPRNPLLSCLGRIVLAACILVVLVAGVAASVGFWVVQRALPQTTGTQTVAGLHDSVSVLRDQWGVPHINGSDLHDVAFAQGYVTAQDRLFQMELNRRVAQGRLAELFGAGTDNSLVEADEFLRTLDLYSAARTELAALDTRTRSMLDAYADGVNAFLATQGLPLEFTLLRTQPEKWSSLDSLAYGRVVALSLDNSWYTKLARALVDEKLGAVAAVSLFPSYPSDNPTLVTVTGQAAPFAPAPGEAAPATAPQPASTGPRISAAQASAVVRGTSVVRTLLGDPADALGSNDWVVDGTRTASGKPLLANDPHLGIRMPAIWYEVALRGGGLDAIGFSFPGVPGIVIGHNAFIAWGVTNVGADNTDLYLETLDPANHPGMYLHDGTWLPLKTTTTTIRVSGGKSIQLTIRSTGHGPLLNDVVGDLKKLPPLALKWTALQPGYSFRGFFELAFARNWQEFLQALSHISISQNFVYADIAGNIGYRMSGVLPIRAPVNGLLPVKGDSSAYEWQGYVPQDQMPTLFNPPTHIIATANQQIVPTVYPVYVTSDWDQGYRARRILDLLSASNKLTPQDFTRIQNDVYSTPAAKLTPVFVAAGAAAGGDAATAANQLRGWDFNMTRDSAAAAVFEVTTGTLMRELLEPKLGKDVYSFYQDNYSPSGKFSVLIGLLGQPRAPFFNNAGARDAAIARAMSDAVHELRTRLGPDISKWRWGALHRAYFAHPLASVPMFGRIFDLAPVERPGDGATINVGGSGDITADPADYAQHTVPSMRQIIDLANFDDSLWVTTTGESGQPFTGHYSDLLPLWDSGRYQSMAFSSRAVAQAGKQLLLLRPQ